MADHQHQDDDGGGRQTPGMVDDVPHYKVLVIRQGSQEPGSEQGYLDPGTVPSIYERSLRQLNYLREKWVPLRTGPLGPDLSDPNPARNVLGRPIPLRPELQHMDPPKMTNECDKHLFLFPLPDVMDISAFRAVIPARFYIPESIFWLQELIVARGRKIMVHDFTYAAKVANNSMALAPLPTQQKSNAVRNLLMPSMQQTSTVGQILSAKNQNPNETKTTTGHSMTSSISFSMPGNILSTSPLHVGQRKVAPAKKVEFTLPLEQVVALVLMNTTPRINERTSGVLEAKRKSRKRLSDQTMNNLMNPKPRSRPPKKGLIPNESTSSAAGCSTAPSTSLAVKVRKPRAQRKPKLSLVDSVNPGSSTGPLIASKEPRKLTSRRKASTPQKYAVGETGKDSAAPATPGPSTSTSTSQEMYAIDEAAKVVHASLWFPPPMSDTATDVGPKPVESTEYKLAAVIDALGLPMNEDSQGSTDNRKRAGEQLVEQPASKRSSLDTMTTRRSTFCIEELLPGLDHGKQSSASATSPSVIFGAHASLSINCETTGNEFESAMTSPPTLAGCLSAARCSSAVVNVDVCDDVAVSADDKNSADDEPPEKWMNHRIPRPCGNVVASDGGNIGQRGHVVTNNGTYEIFEKVVESYGTIIEVVQAAVAEQEGGSKDAAGSIAIDTVVDGDKDRHEDAVEPSEYELKKPGEETRDEVVVVVDADNDDDLAESTSKGAKSEDIAVSEAAKIVVKRHAENYVVCNQVANKDVDVSEFASEGNTVDPTTEEVVGVDQSDVAGDQVENTNEAREPEEGVVDNDVGSRDTHDVGRNHSDASAQNGIGKKGTSFANWLWETLAELQPHCHMDYHCLTSQPARPVRSDVVNVMVENVEYADFPRVDNSTDDDFIITRRDIASARQLLHLELNTFAESLMRYTATEPRAAEYDYICNGGDSELDSCIGPFRRIVKYFSVRQEKPVYYEAIRFFCDRLHAANTEAVPSALSLPSSTSVHASTSTNSSFWFLVVTILWLQTTYEIVPNFFYTDEVELEGGQPKLGLRFTRRRSSGVLEFVTLARTPLVVTTSSPALVLQKLRDALHAMPWFRQSSLSATFELRLSTGNERDPPFDVLTEGCVVFGTNVAVVVHVQLRGDAVHADWNPLLRGDVDWPFK